MSSPFDLRDLDPQEISCRLTDTSRHVLAIGGLVNRLDESSAMVNTALEQLRERWAAGEGKLDDVRALVRESARLRTLAELIGEEAQAIARDAEALPWPLPPVTGA
ncbi:hypothetical protein L6R49_02265 [Myxococcota bacterium]|nr:hypothetical protein [Myxococcota bacterium]